MIVKFLMLLGLVPVVLGLAARKCLADWKLGKAGGEKVSLTSREVAELILKKGGASGVNIEVKRRPFLPVSADSMVISPRVAESQLAVDVAEAALLAGLVLMAQKQEKVVSWRARAVKSGWALPAFTILVVVFAAIVAPAARNYALAAVFGVMGLSTVLLWLTLPVEREAAAVVARYLEEGAMIPRRAEGERLAELVKASAWKRVVPGVLEVVLGKVGKKKAVS